MQLSSVLKRFPFMINIIFLSLNAGDSGLPITLNMGVPPALSCSVLKETTLNFSGQLPFSTLPYKVDIPFHLGGFRYILDPAVWWGARTTRRRQLCGESVCQRMRIKAICKEHTHIKHCGATCYLATTVQVLRRVGNIKAHILPVFCKYNFKGNQ